jgi:acetylornithine/succinyldiaminopimelate/putrescine aminotransferase
VHRVTDREPGRGVLGVDLGADPFGAAEADGGAVKAALEKKLLINCTQGRVIRLLPAMNLSADEVHRGCDILAEVLKNLTVSN